MKMKKVFKKAVCFVLMDFYIFLFQKEEKRKIIGKNIERLIERKKKESLRVSRNQSLSI